MREERGDDLYQRKSTIFVDNLPNGIRKGFVYNLFSRFGRIRDCFIPNKKSKITGQSFGFVRYDYSGDAFQAIDSMNGTWVWGQELVAHTAKFLKKQDRYPNQIYNHYNQENLGDGKINFRYQRDENQHQRFRPQANRGNATEAGKELVLFHKRPQFQMSNPLLKKLGERGKEVWRRKGQPESSNQGGERVLSSKEVEGKDERKILNCQAVGNGWLYRSAVGKLRRLISTQDLEFLFKKEKVESVQIKPMGGRYVVITFSTEDRRNEALKEKWLDLWFEEVSPWNGEAARNERFVWISCFGMPLNAWNVPSFRAIGSIWGCFMEVDNDTLREASFVKGRILIATENSKRIEGEVILIVNGRKYNVSVEEEATFRTVRSKNQFSNSEADEEDDKVDNSDDDMDANNKKEENSDMEKQRNKMSDDLEKNKEEEAEKVERRDINGSPQSGLEKEPFHKKPPLQDKTVEDMSLGNSVTSERNNEESTNSVHGLDSIVPDSQSPLEEECFESVNNSRQSQNTGTQEGNNREQEKETVIEGTNNPVECDSNANLRASQVQGINLHVDLNPSAARRNIRSQRFETSLSKDGDDIDGYIIASQEQEQMAMDKELQNTILAGNNLGIKFGNSGIMRMKKMIEDETKAMKASLINNSFAPLMRDQ